MFVPLFTTPSTELLEQTKTVDIINNRAQACINLLGFATQHRQD